MKQVGIYSGSFNPVHCGHIALADYLVTSAMVDEVWMIRSPHNPLKASSGLLDDAHRLAMLQLAVSGHPGLCVSTVEDDMPTPNYTIHTLCRLREQHPDVGFHLVIGADNWQVFRQWRAWQDILSSFSLIVYPRPGYALSHTHMADADLSHVRFAAEAPQFDVSSTQIRQAIREHTSLRGLIPDAVAAYIEARDLYRTL